MLSSIDCRLQVSRGRRFVKDVTDSNVQTPIHSGLSSLAMSEIDIVAMPFPTPQFIYQILEILFPQSTLNFLLPCEGFKGFVCLQRLSTPYECLFGPQGHQLLHPTPPPPDLLPPSIVTLTIHHPSIALYDWLAHLPSYRNKLPNLSSITLVCSSYMGDNYEIFKFITYPHPALRHCSASALRLSFLLQEAIWNQNGTIMISMPWVSQHGTSSSALPSLASCDHHDGVWSWY
jgi:hypothetical protein